VVLSGSTNTHAHTYTHIHTYKHTHIPVEVFSGSTNTHTHTYTHIHTHKHTYIPVELSNNESAVVCLVRYGVASTSRLLEIIGLFCKRALSNGRYSAKETYNFKEPVVASKNESAVVVLSGSTNTHTHIPVQVTNREGLVVVVLSGSTNTHTHTYTHLNTSEHTHTYVFR